MSDKELAVFQSIAESLEEIAEHLESLSEDRSVYITNKKGE